MVRELGPQHFKLDKPEEGVLVEKPSATKIDVSGEALAALRAEDKAERSTVKVPETVKREVARRELATITPDVMPLHNTFIGADLTRRIGHALAAEHNQLSVEDYLAEGRGEQNMEAAARIDSIKSESERNAHIRGERIRQQNELKHQKIEIGKQLSILERLGTVLELSREASRNLSSKIDAFSDRMLGTFDNLSSAMATANTKLFEKLQNLPDATPRDKQKLENAQQAHALASELESLA